MVREHPENFDFPHCAWCGRPIRSHAVTVEDDRGGLQVYHEDCYRHGLMLEPDKIGWTPVARHSRNSPPQ